MHCASRVLVTIVASLFALSCTGDTGPQGPTGPGGTTGQDGTGVNGEDGISGEDGEDGRNPLLVGPGLELQINSATIDADGLASVRYTLTDGNGRPLDLDGIFTEGPVSPSFIIASLGQNAAGEALQYTSYTVNSAGQAATESSGGNVEIGIGDGRYEYTFATGLLNVNEGRTHTVGMQAHRDFEGERYVANATYDFVPSGTVVTVTRDIVTTEGCNSCHNPLSLHGDRRRDIKLCVMCHQPQSIDPNTGNTVDFKVMVHKIHMGAELPSVQAGGDYEIIGFNNSVHNYNTVGFPQDIRACDTCHTGTDGDFWKTRPTRETCASCHDLTSFAAVVPPGMTAHAPGPMANDNDCTNIGCHQATGGLAGVVDSHIFLDINPAKPNVLITIDEIRNTAPGQVAQADITVTVDGAGLDILSTPLNRLRFTIAGPTTDYREYFQVSAQNNGANAAGTLTAIDASAGRFTYTFPAADPIPALASGSYAMAIEARFASAVGNIDVFNPVAYFAVTDPAPVARRAVVDQAGCDTCHLSLSEHGGSRRNTEYCIMCHNSQNTSDERVARFEGVEQFVESVDFKVLIHKIHSGEDLTQPYVVGGFPAPNAGNPAGTPINFGEVRYPGDMRACGSCHIAGSFDLPLASTVLPTRFEIFTCSESPAADGDEFCNTRVSSEFFVPPTAAVCSSCHDSESSAAHAEIMTTAGGVESCATCHGPGSSFDIAEYHRLNP